MTKKHGPKIGNVIHPEAFGGKTLQDTKTGNHDSNVIGLRNTGPDRGGIAYEAWSEDELYRKARELDIPGRSYMGRSELIAALREREV